MLDPSHLILPERMIAHIDKCIKIRGHEAIAKTMFECPESPYYFIKSEEYDKHVETCSWKYCVLYKWCTKRMDMPMLPKMSI